jgi:hypothetical protein
MRHDFRICVLVVILVGILVGSSHHVLSSADEQSLRSAHQSWFKGLLNEDTKFFDVFFADEITLGFGMRSMPRADFLKLLSSGELFYDDAEHAEVHFRVYGNTGVVTGRSNLKYRFNGVEGYERLHYIAIYVLVETNWKMVAWQSAIGRDSSEE